MALLLKQRGGEVKVTKGVVKAAAENMESGKEVMAHLLKQRGGKNFVFVFVFLKSYSVLAAKRRHARSSIMVEL